MEFADLMISAKKLLLKIVLLLIMELRCIAGRSCESTSLYAMIDIGKLTLSTYLRTLPENPSLLTFLKSFTTGSK